MALTFNPKNHRYTCDTPQGVQATISGVTTLLGGGIPKPALPHWSARVVAEYVDANPQEVERLRGLPEVPYKGHMRSALVDELIKVPNRERDLAANRGTDIHSIAEKLNTLGVAELDGEHTSEIDGYLEFLDTWGIETVLAERMGVNRTEWYAGTFDLIATSPHWEGNALIDLKTSNGVYGEVALQAAAYSRFEVYLNDAGEEVPMPPISRTFVAHIRPGVTDLYSLCESPEEIEESFQQFRCAAYITKTTKRRNGYIKDPLPQPQQTAELAA